MENTGFNQGQYSSYTPKVTQEHNGNILRALLITMLVFTSAVVINSLVKQKLYKNKKS